jgi:hypothetical protein
MVGRPARLATLSLVVVAVALVSGPVRAQLPVAEPPRDHLAEPFLGVEPRRVPRTGDPNAGPPRPSQSHLPPALPVPAPAPTAPALDVHPLLRLSEEYSDNFRLSADDRVENFRTTLSPGLLVGLNRPKTAGSVAAILDVTQDSTNELGDVGFFPRLSAAAKHVVSPRLSLNVFDTFTRSDEPALANEFGLQQQRRTFTKNTLGLSVDWLLDRVATQAYYRLLTFSGATDTVSHIVGAAVGVPLGALTAVSGGYEFSHTRVTERTSSESTGNLGWGTIARQLGPSRAYGLSVSSSSQTFDDTRIWNVSVFHAYQLPGRVSLSASVGYGLLSSDTGGHVSTVTSDTSASYRFARAVIGLAIFQDFNQTFLEGQNFGVVLTRSYTGTFGYALTPQVDLTVRASYTENETTGVGNSPQSRDASVLSGRAGVAWRIRPSLTTSLDYVHARYDGDRAAFGESAPTLTGTAVENRVTLRMTATF